MLRIIVTLLLLVGTMTDNKLNFKCEPCEKGKCIRATGGPFRGDLIHQSCGNYIQLEVQFTCNSICINGCKITVKKDQQTTFTCSRYDNGEKLLKELDKINSFYAGKTVSYDWCSCGSNSSLIVAGMTGSAVALVVLVLVIVLIKKRQERERRKALLTLSQSANRQQSNLTASETSREAVVQ